jgi:cell division protein FtsB
MANQQLIDYLKEQLKAGANKEDLKKTLLNVGWSAVDIEDAFNAIELETKTPPIVIQPEVSKPEVPKENVLDLTKKEVPTVKETSSSKEIPQFISRESFISSAPESFISSKREVDNKNIQTSQVRDTKQVTSMVDEVLKQTTPDTHKKFKIIIYVVFGIVIVGLLGLIIFLYQDNSKLKNQVITSNSQQGDLEAQVQSLTKTINTLQTEISALKSENESLKNGIFDLENQVLLFSPSTSSLDIQLSGKILLDKNQYVLKTSKDIIVSIKNAKDEKVREILSSIVNTEVKVEGQRTLGLREITIKSIEGKKLEDLIAEKEAQKESTIKAQTSTTTQTSTPTTQTPTP